MPQLGHEPFLHPGAYVRNSRLGAFVEIGEGGHILETVMGDYSYTARCRYCLFGTRQIRECRGFHAAEPGRAPRSSRIASPFHVPLQLFLAG